MAAPSTEVDIGSLVTRTPGVYGGRPCLQGTRFPIMQLAVLHNDGVSAEEIARDWSLDLTRVYAGIAYYRANRSAVDAELEAEAKLYAKLAAEQRERMSRGELS